MKRRKPLKQVLKKKLCKNYQWGNYTGSLCNNCGRTQNEHKIK